MLRRVCSAPRRRFSTIQRVAPPWFDAHVQTTDGTVSPSKHSEYLGEPRRDILIDSEMEGRLVHELGLASKPTQVIFQTPVHRALTKGLVVHASMLSEGAFVGTNGMHARTIVGPKGVGKTTVLRQFVHVCEAAFPNVVPVYVSCNDMAASPLSHQSILRVVAGVLQDRGIISGETIAGATFMLYQAVVTALRAAGKFVLLVVDELDELYRVAPSDAGLWGCALVSLANLSSIGNFVTGRFCVMVCGSSAVLPLLVTCNGMSVQSIRTDFPRLTGAPNLNGTKFKVLRLPSVLPNDLATVRTMVAGCDALPGVGKVGIDGVARLALFLSGATPRAAMSALQHSFASGTASVSTAVWAETAPALDGRTGAFHAAVLSELREKNAKLLRRVTDAGEVLPERVAKEDWESDLYPLSWVELQGVWYRVCNAYKYGSGKSVVADGENAAALQAEIFKLCDRGYLTYATIQNGRPEGVYPACAMQLLLMKDTVQATAKALSVRKGCRRPSVHWATLRARYL
jgi:hypothetical protein